MYPRKMETRNLGFPLWRKVSLANAKPFVEASYGNDACLCDSEEKKSVFCQQESNLLYCGLCLCEDSVFIFAVQLAIVTHLNV